MEFGSLTLLPVLDDIKPAIFLAWNFVMFRRVYGTITCLPRPSWDAGLVLLKSVAEELSQKLFDRRMFIF